MFLDFFMLLMMCLFLFLGVAFLTLLERYFLSLSQNRSGPLKVFFLGFFQAIFDALKLIQSEVEILEMPNFFMFFFFPFFYLFFMFIFFMFLNFHFVFSNFIFVMFFILFLVSVFFYLIFLSGYYSKSKYSFLGSLRSSSQVLSFDVNFFFMYLSFFFVFFTFGLLSLFYFYFLFFVLIFCFFIFLMELNRIPFDFPEGESELVSGFNIEFSSIIFIFIFLTEYAFIFFWSQYLNYILLLNIFYFFWFFIFVFLRSVLPRYRYDFLLSLSWLVLLPSICIYFLVYLFNF